MIVYSTVAYTNQISTGNWYVLVYMEQKYKGGLFIIQPWIAYFIIGTMQVRSQDFEKGRLFWKLETTANELDPNFRQSWTRLRRQNQVISKKRSSQKLKQFFRLKNSDLQKKRKSLHQLWMSSRAKNSTILVEITTSPSQLLLPNPVGGGCFHFWSKNLPQKHEKRAILFTFQDNGMA